VNGNCTREEVEERRRMRKKTTSLRMRMMRNLMARTMFWNFLDNESEMEPEEED
jgi:hypothetical protein